MGQERAGRSPPGSCLSEQALRAVAPHLWKGGTRGFISPPSTLPSCQKAGRNVLRSPIATALPHREDLKCLFPVASVYFPMGAFFESDCPSIYLNRHVSSVNTVQTGRAVPRLGSLSGLGTLKDWLSLVTRQMSMTWHGRASFLPPTIVKQVTAPVF